jgi:hypothetical protein
MHTCDGCGFVYDDLPVERIASTIRAYGPAYRAELAGVDDAVARTRPAPEVWSALEYTCHIRDVVLAQRDRAILGLIAESPSFFPIYTDERVTVAHYEAHPPDVVADQLAMAMELCAVVLDGLSADQWARPLLYSMRPQGYGLGESYAATGTTEDVVPARDLAFHGRHTAHLAEHHLGDVRSVLARVRGNGS